MNDTDKIIADAQVAKDKDAGDTEQYRLPPGAWQKIAAVEGDALTLPGWLDRSLTPEQREAEWQTWLMANPDRPKPQRAPAHVIESEIEKISAAGPTCDELRRLEDKEKARVRIAKMKAGLERKAVAASGALQAMPLNDRDALKLLAGVTHGRAELRQAPRKSHRSARKKKPQRR